MFLIKAQKKTQMVKQDRGSKREVKSNVYISERKRIKRNIEEERDK